MGVGDVSRGIPIVPHARFVPFVLPASEGTTVMKAIRPSETWLLLNSGMGTPEHNMALDVELMQTASERGMPLLRFYGWTQPAASYGYFQKLELVESLTKLRPLVRRPTGGGLVPHNADWTYSLAFPPGHWWYRLTAKESYRTLHEWIRDAFARCGVSTELSISQVKEGPGQCFVGAEESDLLRDQKKIAGAAQRRKREGLLSQGSVQPGGLDLGRGLWEDALCHIASQQWNVVWRQLDRSTQIA